MQIIILSGGSGTRLWPLSNDARSKQFLRLLSDPSGNPESMLQRVTRQIKNSDLNASITIATGIAQKDAVSSQLGADVDIVTEPSRRHTFPAICLACEYLAKVKGCQAGETVVVMPCDPFTGDDYFTSISRMARAVEQDEADLLLMGITPTYPSAKYGYILSDYGNNSGTTETDRVVKVDKFIEKPSSSEAEKLIAGGALWNAGVFAFRLGFMTGLAEKYVTGNSFEEIAASFSNYPFTSFDYEVAEKTKSMAMVPYSGNWKDLGTWNTLTDEISWHTYGNVIADDSNRDTHIFNELDMPLLCIGTSGLVIAASPDGILITDKSRSEDIKNFATQLKHRPMYEERRWGVYRVIDHTEAPDGHCSLTKRLTLNPGASISYQRHACRDEVWTFVDGEGEIVLDEQRKPVRRGDTIVIPAGTMHALRATTPLTFIEVQSGTKLIEEDIERFSYEW